MKLFSNLKKDCIKHPNLSFLYLVLFIFSLLRIPSLIEPYWYGDEGIYGVIGHALRSGRLLYQGIYDNKPPLLYVVYAIFNSNLFWVRFVSLSFGLAAVVCMYLLAKKLFQSRIAYSVTTIVFAILFGLPLLEGNIANAENFMAAPILAAFYVLFKSKGKYNSVSLIISGLLFSIAFLFKIVALFDFCAAVGILFILTYDESIIITFKNKKISIKIIGQKLLKLICDEIIFGISFVIPILFTVLYFVFHGAFLDFYHATFSQNVGYVGYGNYFLIPQGILYAKVLLLLFVIMAVFVFKNKMNRTGVVIYIWTAFAIFNAFFDSRSYTHYMLVLLPAFCLLTGFIFEKTKFQIVNSVLVIGISALVLWHFTFYNKVIQYYENYISYMAGQKSVKDYLHFFDTNTPRDYAVAQFIDMFTNLKDSIFLWSDSGQIYVLADKLPPGKYITAYHITDYDKKFATTIADVARVKPKFIIDTKHDGNVKRFTSRYELTYQIGNADIYESQF